MCPLSCDTGAELRFEHCLRPRESSRDMKCIISTVKFGWKIIVAGLPVMRGENLPSVLSCIISCAIPLGIMNVHTKEFSSEDILRSLGEALATLKMDKQSIGWDLVALEKAALEFENRAPDSDDESEPDAAPQPIVSNAQDDARAGDIPEAHSRSASCSSSSASLSSSSSDSLSSNPEDVPSSPSDSESESHSSSVSQDLVVTSSRSSISEV